MDYQGNLEYKTDLFDEATMIRLIKDFQTILEASIAHPNWRMTEFHRVCADGQKQRNPLACFLKPTWGLSGFISWKFISL